MDIIPQILGIFAVITFLLSYQQKKRANIIVLNTVSRYLYIMQYILLSAFSGAVLDVLGVISSVVAGKKRAPFIKKHTTTTLVLINGCIILAGGAIAISNNSWLDLFPLAGVLLHTSAFWITNETVIRRVSLLGSPFWFVYNISTRAYGSAIGDILTMCSIIVAMIRYRHSDDKAIVRSLADGMH